jgi:hypothetical protein
MCVDTLRKGENDDDDNGDNNNNNTLNKGDNKNSNNQSHYLRCPQVYCQLRLKYSPGG